MFTKEYFQDRIDSLIINKKISNKKPRNLDPYSVTDGTKEIDCNHLRTHHHDKLLNTPVKDIAT